MKLLTIYGASDDLVEFDGAFREEYNVYEPALFLVKIRYATDEARFAVAATFCNTGWRLSIETWTAASNIPVHVEFTQRHDSGELDPMIVFHLEDGAEVTVEKL